MKIKQGDTVQVIAGKDKGKTGQVLKALHDQDQVIVDGIGVVKRHQRNRRLRSQGQIIEKPMPVHVSNVALVEDGKPVRVGYVIEGEGEKQTKVRVSKKTGKKI
ncbi:MAG: 50S ribosomal protein L24 [Patescibacteria group bacterium]